MQGAEGGECQGGERGVAGFSRRARAGCGAAGYLLEWAEMRVSCRLRLVALAPAPAHAGTLHAAGPTAPEGHMASLACASGEGGDDGRKSLKPCSTPPRRVFGGSNNPAHHDAITVNTIIISPMPLVLAPDEAPPPLWAPCLPDKHWHHWHRPAVTATATAVVAAPPPPLVASLLPPLAPLPGAPAAGCCAAAPRTRPWGPCGQEGAQARGTGKRAGGHAGRDQGQQQQQPQGGGGDARAAVEVSLHACLCARPTAKKRACCWAAAALWRIKMPTP